MQVELAEERILVFADRFNLDQAEGRAWAHRVDAFGTAARLGGFINRAQRTTTSASIASADCSRSGGSTVARSRCTSGCVHLRCRLRRRSAP